LDRNRRCTFFGHRNFSGAEYNDYIQEIFEYLIVKKKVDEFLSGGMGNFDRTCESIVRKLREKYSNIELKLILPYPGYSSIQYMRKSLEYYNEIVIPNISKFGDSENVIAKRNRYMVDRCGFVLSGVYKQEGGSVNAVNYAAERKDVRIINIFKNKT